MTGTATPRDDVQVKGPPRGVVLNLRRDKSFVLNMTCVRVPSADEFHFSRVRVSFEHVLVQLIDSLLLSFFGQRRPPRSLAKFEISYIKGKEMRFEIGCSSFVLGKFTRVLVTTMADCAGPGLGLCSATIAVDRREH